MDLIEALLRRSPTQILDQLAQRRHAERFRAQHHAVPGDVGQRDTDSGFTVGHAGARRDHEQHARGRQRPHDEAGQQQRPVVRRLGVVDHDQHRPGVCRSGDGTRDRPETGEALRLEIVAPGPGWHGRRRDVRIVDLAELLDDVRPRPQRRRTALVPTRPPCTAETGRAGHPHRLGGESGLADPGVTDDAHEPTGPGGGGLDRGGDRRQLP